MTHFARWDLDKTYLRTEFDTLRDLVKTAFERPDEKRENPGASTLMREMSLAGSEVHILSGSPEQMRGRLEAKLRLDGIQWKSFTLKPNLENILKLRFRAVRDQLGYKLPKLLEARANVVIHENEPLPKETLFGDDAEADAFVYAIYRDFMAGRIEPETVLEVLERARVYDDVFAKVEHDLRRVQRGDVVDRIFIHLERQSAPADFAHYGPVVVPFYNYMQPALVLYEDQRVSAAGVLNVARELVSRHRFGGSQLVRTYRDLLKRGHLRGIGSEAFPAALSEIEKLSEVEEEALSLFVESLEGLLEETAPMSRWTEGPVPDYVSLAASHNKRRHKE